MESFFARHHFWIRRIHSLSGIVPIGAFLLEHLFSNAYAFGGPEKFNDHVAFLQSVPQPFLALFEWGLIIGPIAFHALLGIWISMQGSVNLAAYPHARNWLYLLQRLTGILTLAYVVVHLWQFRLADAGVFADLAFSRRAFQETARVLGNPFWFWFYVAGLASTLFHFANGIGLFCHHWGITVTEKSQRAVLVAGGALGAFLFAVGVASMAAFLK